MEDQSNDMSELELYLRAKSLNSIRVNFNPYLLISIEIVRTWNLTSLVKVLSCLLPRPSVKSHRIAISQGPSYLD
jgi:hypothetical protein